MSDPYAHPSVPEPESGQPTQSWPPPPGYQPPLEQRTNGFAIASLVFGIISGILLAVIFGACETEVKRQRPNGDSGANFAELPRRSIVFRRNVL